MADQLEDKKPRRRRQRSKIEQAQEAARKRQGRTPGRPSLQRDPNNPEIRATGKSVDDARREMGLQDSLKELSRKGGKNLLPEKEPDSTVTPGILSMVSEAVKKSQAEERARAQGKTPLTDPANYGSRGLERLRAARAIADQRRVRRLQAQGKDLVYMGPVTAKVPVPGRERVDPDSPGRLYDEGPVGDNIVEHDMLLSWLAIPDRYELILAQARKAGLNPKDDTELEQVWRKALQRSHLAFNAGQKVTPWAAMALMAKGLGPGGRPADRTTTQTSVDDVDPATARRMIQSAAKEFLGKDPTKAQVDDFIARAQLVAKQNPQVTKTTTSYDFDGQPVSSFSSSSGGSDAVNDQMLLEAEEMAKADPDYAEYQAGGVLFPLLGEAFRSPV